MYILIPILFIFLCILDIYESTLNANIVHLKNGREPNAGITLMPYLFLIFFFMGTAYILNLLIEDLGFYIIFTLFGIYALFTIFTLPRTVKIFNQLLKERNQKSCRPPD